MFIGEYRHSLDAKNRLIIPSRFRNDLGNTFVIAKGLDGCLTIYTASAWEKQLQQLEKLPLTNKAARQYTRFVTSGAAECQFDSQGRIQLPQSLINYAGIEKECVIIGAGESVEVWDTVRWDHYNEETANNFDEVAESLTEFLK